MGPNQKGMWEVTYLDVLYHDAVSEAMRLQVSFDVFQLRERNSHIHREAGPGWATPEVHLGHKGKENGCV